MLARGIVVLLGMVVILGCSGSGHPQARPQSTSQGQQAQPTTSKTLFPNAIPGFKAQEGLVEGKGYAAAGYDPIEGDSSPVGYVNVSTFELDSEQEAQSQLAGERSKHPIEGQMVDVLGRQVYIGYARTGRDGIDLCGIVWAKGNRVWGVYAHAQPGKSADTSVLLSAARAVSEAVLAVEE